MRYHQVLRFFADEAVGYTYPQSYVRLFGADEKRVQREQVVLFGNDGNEVAISVPEGAASPLDVLVIAGVPLNEPVARYGPFVMNTEEEIRQAIDDYRSGRMGKIDF